MVTLLVTCFVAGLVPFQILDKTTGQLVETIRITEEKAKNEGIRANKADKEKRAIALLASEQATVIHNDLSAHAIAPQQSQHVPELVDDALKRAEFLRDILRGSI